MMSGESAVAQFEDRAKKILKSELKRRGITYAQLAEKLSTLGVNENERNLANKISRGSFTAAFFMMCMDVINSQNHNVGAFQRTLQQ